MTTSHPTHPDSLKKPTCCHLFCPCLCPSEHQVHHAGAMPQQHTKDQAAQQPPQSTMKKIPNDETPPFTTHTGPICRTSDEPKQDEECAINPLPTIPYACQNNPQTLEQHHDPAAPHLSHPLHTGIHQQLSSLFQLVLQKKQTYKHETLFRIIQNSHSNTNTAHLFTPAVQKEQKKNQENKLTRFAHLHMLKRGFRSFDHIKKQ